MSHEHKDDSNVGALVHDSYVMLESNQNKLLMQERLYEQSSNIGTFVEDSYVGSLVLSK